MKLTLKRAKILLEAEQVRQTALILCDTPEEAEDVLRAACCWLTHVDLQATPKEIADLEKSYLESQSRLADRVLGDPSKGVIFPVANNDNFS